MEWKWKAQNKKTKRGRVEGSLWKERKSRYLEQRDSKMIDARIAT